MDDKSRYPWLGYPATPPPYERHQRSSSPRQKLSSVYRDRFLRRLALLAACLTSLWLFSRHCLFPVPESLVRYHDLDVAAAVIKEEQIQSTLGPEGTIRDTKKVPLEAHIMSKCPDAKRCLQDMVVPAMANVSDKVDFQLSYIGSIDPNSDAVSCMHGPPECLGNMILLCAQKLYPEPVRSLGYANCVISSYKQIPERQLVESCALEHGLDFSKINSCISDEGEGVGLLRDSVMRTEAAGVTKSCTVRVNGKSRCIMDGGEWKDCPMGHEWGDLVDEINKIYDA